MMKIMHKLFLTSIKMRLKELGWIVENLFKFSKRRIDTDNVI